MGLLEILHEQETFGFTGRINALEKNSGRFLGVVFQEEGLIINSVFRDERGKKALFRLVMEDLEQNSQLKFVVEPEIIEEADRRFELPVREFRARARDLFEKAQKSRHLRPPGHVKLMVKSDFIVKGADVTQTEFDLLNILTEYNQVNDIYKNSPLLEFETTNALVSLRKKGALKVLG